MVTALRARVEPTDLTDWLWLLDDQEHTQVFEEIFGARPMTATVVLVIGRDNGLAPADRRRLEWRRDHVVINSQHLYCCTFDELVRDLRWRARWRPWIQESVPPS